MLGSSLQLYRIKTFWESGRQDVAQWAQIGGGDLKGSSTFGHCGRKATRATSFQEWFLYASFRSTLSTVFIQINILDPWQKH